MAKLLHRMARWIAHHPVLGILVWLVPAILALLGRHAMWMPKWLGRIIPRIDIEGRALTDEASPEATEE